jgi:hypothetical protein
MHRLLLTLFSSFSPKRRFLRAGRLLEFGLACPQYHRGKSSIAVSMVHLLISSFFQTSYFFRAHLSDFVS